jgi:chromosome segregation ATPase
MKTSKIPLINAVGCAVLLAIVAVQWWQGENRRDAFLALSRQSNELSEQRDEAIRRAESFEADLQELKKSLMDTQVAADQASLAKKNYEGDLQRLQAERDALMQQVEAWKKQSTEWEKALKERDQALLERNEALVQMRKKLDEAIAQLKKAGAQ